MVKCWIFVSHPNSAFSVGTLSEEAFEETAIRWAIGSRTQNRNRIAAGDKVLFYRAGHEGKKIFASAILRSSLMKDDEGFYVKLDDLKIWKTPVEIKKCLPQLSFIKKKKQWGSYFQGGIIALPGADYYLILKISKHNLTVY